MKKFMGIVTALVLTFAMTTTAFASESVEATIKAETKGITIATDANASAEVKVAIAEKKELLEKKEVLKKTLGDKATDTAIVVAVIDIAGDATVKEGTTVTVEIPSVVAGEKYVLIHYLADGTTEVLETTVSAGKLSFKAPKTWSVFAIVKVAEAAKSPKTGETSGIAAIVVILICAAGLVVLNKKKEV